MKIFVLYDRAGIHSGRQLGISMGKELAGKAQIVHGRLDTLQKSLNQGRVYDYIINVGWYKDFNTGGATVLNLPGAIATSSNKKRAREIFDKQGIPAPALWTNPHDIPDSEFPVVARTTHHSKGSGFWLCKNRSEAVKSTESGNKVKKKLITTKKGARVWRDREVHVEGSTHFMKFIPNTREFRVHLVSCESALDGLEDDYLSIKTSEKLPNPEANSNAVIKNHDNGWVFSYPKDRKDPILKTVREVAKACMSKLGLHWGAVDIMVSKDTGEPYVLEVNSSPCMTDANSNTVEKYISGLASLMGIYPKIEKKVNIPEIKEVILEKNKIKKDKVKKLFSKYKL